MALAETVHSCFGAGVVAIVPVSVVPTACRGRRQRPFREGITMFVELWFER